MQFLMLVCRDTAPIDPSATPGGDVEEWVSTMDGRGLRLAGDRLASEAEASVVRVRGGKVLVTDGPFLETKEALGGFDLLECRDLAEAIEVAAAHPFAALGVMELRPIWTG
ncbi:MAG: YciI family protein [Jatrophihabitantaceae bacterium]